MNTLLLDFRGQMSWGRFCSMVALLVAVSGQFSGMDTDHLVVWLGVALGNYGLAKASEAIVGRP